MTYLEYHDDKSDKFWQIVIQENKHTVTYGKIGTQGQSKTKEFADVDSCQKDAQKLIKAKKAKGYSENGEGSVIARQQPIKSQVQKVQKKLILDELNALIEQGDYQKVLPFLQTYQENNITWLKKEISKLRHYWLDWQELKDDDGRRSHWGSRGKDKQRTVIALLGLALLSKNDISNRWDCIYHLLINNFFIHNHKNLELLKAINPTCIEALILLFDKNGWGIKYDNLRFYEKLGFISYHPSLFTKSLVHSIEKKYFYFDCVNKNIKVKTDIYFKDIEHIIDREIPDLFNYETDIQNSSNWVYWQLNHQNNKNNDKIESIDAFHQIFIYLIENKKLDRNWVLIKCLEIQTSLWQDNTKSYFKKLFLLLNPSQEELIELQDNIFSLLNSENKSVVNFSLSQIKEIYQQDDFNMADFISYIEIVLMNFNNKTAIKTTISISQNILKNDSKDKLYTLDILLALTNVFMIDDLSLQERTAKIIKTYCKDKEKYQELSDKISIYQDSILNDAKNIIKFLFDDQSNEEYDNDDKKTVYEYKNTNINYFDDNKIVLYQDFHELLFSLSGLKSNKNPLEYEKIINSWLLLSYENKFPEDVNKQIESVLDNKNYYGDFISNNIYDIFQSSFYSLVTKNEILNPAKIYSYREYNYKILYTWANILRAFYYLNSDNQGLTLLSLPTHYPSFIKPTILIDRLLEYQNKNVNFDFTDLSVALARTPKNQDKDDNDILFSKIDKLNNQYLKEILYCHFGKIKLPDTIPPKSWIDKISSKEDNLIIKITSKLKEYFNKHHDNRLDLSRHATDKITIENWQSWRGLWATSILTHHQQVELDSLYEDGKMYDKVIVDIADSDNKNSKNKDESYIMQPIYEYGYENQKWKRIIVGHAIAYKAPKYFRLASAADIYRRQYYQQLQKSSHWNDTGLYDYYDEFGNLFAFVQRLTPINTLYADKSFANSMFSLMESKNSKEYTTIIQLFMEDSYSVNKYTLMILAYLLFHSKKDIRLVAIDGLHFLINKQKIDISLLSQHIQAMIKNKTAPFSRFIESITLLNQYGSVNSSFVLQLIDDILSKIVFLEKQPVGFKKMLELYYTLLNQFQQKASAEVLENLDILLAQASGLKSIVAKIKKIS